MFFKKKPLCSHQWYKLKGASETIYENIAGCIDSYDQDVVFVFCPFCKSREKVSPLEWELREKEQEILESKRGVENV